jgi:hypothetical protein
METFASSTDPAAFACERTPSRRPPKPPTDKARSNPVRNKTERWELIRYEVAIDVIGDDSKRSPKADVTGSRCRSRRDRNLLLDEGSSRCNLFAAPVSMTACQ